MVEEGVFIVDRSQRHLEVSRLNPAIERRRERGEWSKRGAEDQGAHGRFA